MSDKQAISDALGVPFPRSAIQTHPQTKLSYVAGHTYIHRLNDATKNTWDWKIVRQDFHPYGATGKGNARLLITVIGELTIPGLGTRAGMGVQVVTADTGGEDMWKGAMTDAIKAAAKLFGVGLELYGPDYEAGELPAAPPRQRNVSQNTVPNAPQAPVANKAPASASEHPTMDQKGLTAIFALTNKRGISNDDLHAIVSNRYGVDSLKELRVDHGRDLYHLLQKESDEGLKHEISLATGTPEDDINPLAPRTSNPMFA
jgi:Rad52/22 family double-strand break repair protein.